MTSPKNVNTVVYLCDDASECNSPDSHHEPTLLHSHPYVSMRLVLLLMTKIAALRASLDSKPPLSVREMFDGQPEFLPMVDDLLHHLKKWP